MEETEYVSGVVALSFSIVTASLVAKSDSVVDGCENFVDDVGLDFVVDDIGNCVVEDSINSVVDSGSICEVNGAGISVVEGEGRL